MLLNMYRSAGQTPSTSTEHQAKVLQLMNSYLHVLPTNSVMHAHADFVQRQSTTNRNGSSAAHTLAANECNPDSTLLSKSSSRLCCIAVRDCETAQGTTFPLSWPPSESPDAETYGLLTVSAQMRDIHAWYRSCVTAVPFVAEVGDQPPVSYTHLTLPTKA